MNYYPFHLGDYAAHTAHLEPLEDIAYRRMLDLYYRTEKPLPSDASEVARLIRMKDYQEHVEAVLSEFFVLKDDGFCNDRCEEEIERFIGKREKARASANASVEARRANAKRTLNGRSAKAELTRTITRTKEIPPNPLSGGRFGEFWNLWPNSQRKVARQQCEAKWKSRGLDEIADKVLSSLKGHIASEAWQKDGGQFVPAPLVWLNQARWEADVTPAADVVAIRAVEQTNGYLQEFAEHAAKAVKPSPEVLARLGIRRAV